MEVVEASGHDPRGRVRQVEGVTQLVQRGSQSCHVVGPVVLPENYTIKQSLFKESVNDALTWDMLYYILEGKATKK